MKNLQKNLNIIWQPPPFLGKPPDSAYPPPLFWQKFSDAPISINFEKVEPPTFMKGVGGPNYAQYLELDGKQGTNSFFTLCKLQSVFYQLRSDFVRFSKFCEVNIFDFQNNIFYR